jgi:hypothetical protein
MEKIFLRTILNVDVNIWFIFSFFFLTLNVFKKYREGTDAWYNPSDIMTVTTALEKINNHLAVTKARKMAM